MDERIEILKKILSSVIFSRDAAISVGNFESLKKHSETIFELRYQIKNMKL